MRWYWYLLLFLLTGILSYSQLWIFPGMQLIDPLLISCFLILRHESSKKVLWTVFLFTMMFDFMVLGSQIRGVSTLAILPIMYLGIFLKEHVLPTFSDLLLFVFFFFGFLVNHVFIRWFYSLFNVTIPWGLPVLTGFRMLGHAAIFGAVLIFLGRFRRNKL